MVVATRVAPGIKRVDKGQLRRITGVVLGRCVGVVQAQRRSLEGLRQQSSQQLPDRIDTGGHAYPLGQHRQCAVADNRAQAGAGGPTQHAQQRAFAGAVGADDGDLLAVSDAETHVAQQHSPGGQPVPDAVDIDVCHVVLVHPKTPRQPPSGHAVGL